MNFLDLLQIFLLGAFFGGKYGNTVGYGINPRIYRREMLHNATRVCFFKKCTKPIAKKRNVWYNLIKKFALYILRTKNNTEE